MGKSRYSALVLVLVLGVLGLMVAFSLTETPQEMAYAARAGEETVALAPGWAFSPAGEWRETAPGHWSGPSGITLRVQRGMVKAAGVSPASMNGRVDYTQYASGAYANSFQKRFEASEVVDRHLLRLGDLHGLFASVKKRDGSTAAGFLLIEGVKATGRCGAFDRVLELSFELPAGVPVERAAELFATIRRAPAAATVKKTSIPAGK